MMDFNEEFELIIPKINNCNLLGEIFSNSSKSNLKKKKNLEKLTKKTEIKKKIDKENLIKGKDLIDMIDF